MSKIVLGPYAAQVQQIINGTFATGNGQQDVDALTQHQIQAVINAYEFVKNNVPLPSPTLPTIPVFPNEPMAP